VAAAVGLGAAGLAVLAAGAFLLRRRVGPRAPQGAPGEAARPAVDRPAGFAAPAEVEPRVADAVESLSAEEIGRLQELWRRFARRLR
jgi:hypothetical protein